jgi:hypothetical protein
MKTELLAGTFGEFQPQNVYALYGVPNVGKTLMVMTEVASLASQGIRTLWIDTEGGLNFDGGAGIWGAWKEKLEKRFGLKDLNEFVEYKRVTGYEELMKYLGQVVEIEFGEGKMGILRKGKTRRGEETVYDSFGRKRGNCVIVLDSLSNVFRVEFGSTLQNFPSRGDATGLLTHAMNLLMEKVNAPLITTNHASLNPSNPWQFAQMRGGSMVAYWSKNVAYLEKPKKRALDTYRKVWAFRSPLYKELGHNEWMRIDNDKAFVNSSEEEVQAAIEAAATAKRDKEEAAEE